MVLPSTELRLSAVLAGGQSRRFGSDKALAQLGEETLLSASFAALPCAERRLVIAPSDRLYDLPENTLWPERRLGEGPLAGLETALECAAEMGGGWVALQAVDQPLVSAALWRWLLAAPPRHPRATLFVLRDAAGRLQPLPGLYHSDVLGELRGLLDRGERRMQAAAGLSGAKILPAPPQILSLLRDVDTPEALLDLNEASPSQG